MTSIPTALRRGGTVVVGSNSRERITVRSRLPVAAARV